MHVLDFPTTDTSTTLLSLLRRDLPATSFSLLETLPTDIPNHAGHGFPKGAFQEAESQN